MAEKDEFFLPEEVDRQIERVNQSDPTPVNFIRHIANFLFHGADFALFFHRSGE